MNRSNLAFLAVALIVAAFAACSGDSTQHPTDAGSYQQLFPVSSSARVVGPSEIVMCLDVSDSISGAELRAQIEDLSGCLTDNSLFPSNGHVGLSIWAYGDTIAAVVRDITPVNETNVKDVFGPALTGLLDDRLVGGASADLATALNAAGVILGGGSSNDRQILISGSGEARDEQAVRNACGELERTGVLVSAIGIDPTTAGEKLLMDCAGAGQGIYVAAVEGQSACQEAFAWMLVVELDVEPDTAKLSRGEEHRLEAAVFRAGDLRQYPEVGLEVGFRVASGPNSGLDQSATTDTNGVAKWAYTGDGGAGTDVIVATVNHPQTGEALVDTVTVDWLNAAPSCDAGGPYSLTVDADTVHIQLDGSASSDADGDTLSYQWSVDCEGASFDDASLAMPMLTLTGDCLCMDSLVVELTVGDGMDSSSCEAVVSLDEARPPVLVAKDPYQLWPPNHKYRGITPGMVLESAEDACGNPMELSEVIIVEVRSDEPDDGNGDGSTVDDILVTCPHDLQLRAERQGGADGRVYTILYRITDADGNAAQVEAQVYVPHDQGKGMAPSAGGDGYAVTPECSED